MSDTPIDPVPVLDYLRERERELRQVIDDATARLEEVRSLLTALSDGRTRVRRRLREVPTPEAPPGDAA